MSVKQFDVPGIGTVHVYKRAGTRNLRLSVRSDGSIRVTIPGWMAYAAGVSFARSRADWIRAHAIEPTNALTDGHQVGKSHRLRFQASLSITKPTSRIRQTEIVISYPEHMTHEDEAVQKLVGTASVRALRAQASQLLPIRLGELARKHNFSYKSVTIKNLKTRWGSCDQDGNIVLNLYLMQLPWHLIDYVLLHELTHTRIMRHGPPFWSAMAALEPKTQSLRREIRTHRTALH
jgi:predicted metal-dependent hydrolase